MINVIIWLNDVELSSRYGKWKSFFTGGFKMCTAVYIMTCKWYHGVVELFRYHYYFTDNHNQDCFELCSMLDICRHKIPLPEIAITWIQYIQCQFFCRSFSWYLWLLQCTRRHPCQTKLSELLSLTCNINLFIHFTF